MHRYFIELAFLGTNFHGWQVQNNAHSVQAEVNNALNILLKQEISVVGAGRTDAGVHAKQMFCHFDLEGEIPLEDFVFKLNSILPDDIVARGIFPVPEDCHARFSAIGRKYEYHIILNEDPFLQQLAWRVYPKPDFGKMNQLEEILLKYENFSAFSKSHTQTKTNICHISEAKWVQTGENHWVFNITADRFLRNMVRAIVGTMLEIGWGKKNFEDMEAVIQSKDRRNAGFSVPAKGLYLSEIKYPDKYLILHNEQE